ncbi:MAG TPA: VWA domain-containing protein [Candidatus Dormibacteraeota bacterium]|nr:VWA domain-containing protein [Candidatus Dormibacteraeota bacterium]
MKRVAAGLLTASLFVTLGAMSVEAQAPPSPQPGQSPQQAPPPQSSTTPAQQPQSQSGGVSISVEVPLVTIEVGASTANGDLITGLKRENFRVYEDGVPQQITNFGPSDSPITMVLVLEFGSRSYGLFGYLAKYWSQYLFANLKQQDWIALETFDMRTRVEQDFTQNKEEVLSAINHLYFPGFTESNVFDALLETTDRLKDVKGKKSIVLIASGVDTFSKHNLDQTMKQLRQSDVPIFCIGLGEFLMTRSNMGSLREMDYLQAQNQLKTFSKETGGYAWFPRFEGEMPEIFRAVTAFLRNQYSISYSPSNRARDGKFRKVKIELVAPDGSPLTVQDQKGKKQKYVVYAREGYNAPKGAD